MTDGDETWYTMSGHPQHHFLYIELFFGQIC